jgi:hypothetical protein
MLGDMKTSFGNALKSTEPIPLPQVTPPVEILVALEMIPDLARSDLLLVNVYSKHFYNSQWN